MASRGPSSLCASCDRCRARKTRCDGKRPCSACKQKYMKKHKLTSVEGVDPARFECFYSPAKRRGPVPGHKQYKDNDVVGSSGKIKKSRKQPSSDPVNHGALSINVAEDGSVTSTPSAGGGYIGMMSGGSSNGMSMGNSHQGTANKNYGGSNYSNSILPPLDPNAAAMQQHVLSTLGTIGLNMFPGNNYSSNNGPNNNVPVNNGSGNNYSSNNGSGNNGSVGGMGAPSPPATSNAANSGSGGSSGGQPDTMATAQNAAQQQLAYIQQLQLQQQIQAQKQRRDMNAVALGSMAGAATVQSAGNIINNNSAGAGGGRKNNIHSGNMGGNRYHKPGPTQQLSNGNDKSTSKRVIGCEHTSVVKYIPLIHPTNPQGMHLRACYTLSTGGLFGLPPIPTDEEYCRRFDKSLEPHQLPKFDMAALQAARLAELAMGALADTPAPNNNGNGQSASAQCNSLLLTLANASILCMRDCVEEFVHPSLLFEVARTYFFHAIIRAQLNDMERYFKYRRICMRNLAQLDGVASVETLMAAISFQDSLSYMIYNASEEDLPYIDAEIPRISPPHDVGGMSQISHAEKMYGISILPSRMASNPINQMWIQGAPPVLINENAPTKSRVLDALACAIRTTLDESKSRQTKEPSAQSSRGRIVSRKRKFLSDAEAKDKSPTEWAVEHHPDQLSCSNLLAQASNLLRNDEEVLPSMFSGHRLLVSALQVIVNMDRESGNFQLHSILNVLEGILERPILFSQGGPTYHIMNNCAIFLAHIINKLKASGLDTNSDQFAHALNVYNGSRIVLEKHRSKLPYRLHCHEMPTPNITAVASNGGLVFDMSNVPLCLSSNCQESVAMGITTAEVARRLVSNKYDKNNHWQRTESEREFDVNDRALLAVLSRIISQEEQII